LAFQAQANPFLVESNGGSNYAHQARTAAGGIGNAVWYFKFVGAVYRGHQRRYRGGESGFEVYGQLQD
jgi:hypothetical protein